MKVDSFREFREEVERIGANTVVADHNVSDDPADQYFSTICDYVAFRPPYSFEEPEIIFTEITRTNAPKKRAEDGTASSSEYVVKKTFLTDYARISENLESLPENVEKILNSGEYELEINSEMYKHDLKGLEKCTEM